MCIALAQLTTITIITASEVEGIGTAGFGSISIASELLSALLCAAVHGASRAGRPGFEPRAS